MVIEIVDLSSYKMVDLSSSLCDSLPEGFFSILAPRHFENRFMFDPQPSIPRQPASARLLHQSGHATKDRGVATTAWRPAKTIAKKKVLFNRETTVIDGCCIWLISSVFFFSVAMSYVSNFQPSKAPT